MFPPRLPPRFFHSFGELGARFDIENEANEKVMGEKSERNETLRDDSAVKNTKGQQVSLILHSSHRRNN